LKISQLNSSSLPLAKLQSNEKVSRVISQERQESQSSFKEILNNTVEATSELQFSKHATQRLKLRDINLSDSQLTRIENGITKAKQKGIKDSLVLVDNIALVVNTKNNIVITAMEQAKDNENIYTNIDGAVIV
jgi:flagellar operon protein